MENQIDIFNDPDISSLKSELKELEEKFNELTNEKSECEKLLFDFHHRHTLELGKIILEILKLRKLKFKHDRIKFDDAARDETRYKEQVETEKNKYQYIITDEEKTELKRNFRKATFLCHPDKVHDFFKDSAEKIFIDLKLAYEANDLKKVSEILTELEKGNYFRTKSETIAGKDKFITKISKLKSQIQKLKKEIEKVKESDSFQTISEIKNWDSYFKTAKKCLMQELDELRNETLR